MKKAAPFLILLAGMLWGSMGLFVRTLNGRGLESMGIVSLRAIVTAVSMLIFLLIFDRRYLRIKIRDIWCFFGTGILSIIFFNYCYFSAITLTSMSVAAVLLYTAPAIVMVLSALLFHERMTVRKVLCCLLAVAGCAFASGIGGELFAGASAAAGGASAAGTSAAAAGSSAAGSLITPAGLLLGLGAGLGYALYSIFSRIILNRGYSVYTNVCYSFGVAMLGFFALSCADGTIGQVFESPARTALALLCGLLTGSLAYVLYTSGMKGMETSRAAQLTTIEPVTAALLGFFLFHQPLSLWEVAGIVMVVVSVILMNTGE